MYHIAQGRCEAGFVVRKPVPPPPDKFRFLITVKKVIMWVVPQGGKMTSANKLRWMTGAMLLSLLALAGAAAYLALHRIFQVDEAQNLFMTHVVATHQSNLYFSNALLWMLGPMSALVSAQEESFKIFTSARLLFLGVFVLNIYLLALNTGRKLTTFAGVAALFGAATLAPLWDYGFEIRHDNLILTGLLLMWWLGRTAPRGRWSYVGLGVLSVCMPFLSLKAIVYVAPLSLAFLALPPPAHGQGRAPLLGAWLLGAAGGAVAVAAAYLVSGAWPVFLAGLQAGAASGATAVRMDPEMALGRLPRQVPLLRELVAMALCWVVVTLCRERRAALTWDGLLPEALLTLGSYGALLINPTPFPYNLVNLVPFAYLLAFRFGAPLVAFDWGWRHAGAALFGVLLLWQVLPFADATRRHFAYTNERQKTLMDAAEALTDARKDRVYDAIGMLPTRASIGYNWYNHTLNKAAFANGSIASVASMLNAHPASVIIRSYRTNMLPDAGWQFIEQRYIALSDDFWLLGGVLAPGGGNYTVLHPGRYLVMQSELGRLLPLRGARVAGKPVAQQPVELAVGSVSIGAPPGVRPAVVWVGPRLATLPAIGPGYHDRLFINFY